VFLGHSVTRSQTISNETAKMIDNEVRRIVEEAESTARKVLTDQMEDLHKVAKGLLEYETLTGEEVQAVIDGDEIHRAEPGDSEGDSGRRSSVPSSGKLAKAKDSPGGLEPEPQPAL
jgi:cell division protease FtsH